MDEPEEQKIQLYEDALYFHLIHNGKKVIKNKYGMFWDKRNDLLKKEDKKY